MQYCTHITIGVLFPISLYPISHTVSQLLSCLPFTFGHLIEPHTTGSCPESIDLPAVAALSAALAIVGVLLAVAILTIILLYTSESGVVVSCMRVVRVCVCVCAHAFKGMSLSDH